MWVYGNVSQTNDDCFPFLFINGGVATLSGSALGAAIVRDTVTQREMQFLEHTGIRRLYSLWHSLTLALVIAGRRISVIVRPDFTRGCNGLISFLSIKAYHVSNERYSIATADRGPSATIKIWTTQRSPSRVSRGF